MNLARLITIKNRDGYFKMILVNQDTKLCIDGRQIMVPANCCVCLNETEIIRDIPRNLLNRMLCFHPSFLNPNFNYKVIRESNPSFIRKNYTLYRFWPFLDRGQRPFGVIPLIPYLYHTVDAVWSELNNAIKSKCYQFWPCEARSLLIQLLSLVEYRVWKRGSLQLQGKIAFYLLDHLSENVDIEQIAESLNINPQYFGDGFCGLFNMRFKEYVNMFKVSLACYTLIFTNMSITQITYEFGFSNPAHFSSIFKRIKGVSPSCYRKDAFTAASHCLNAQIYYPPL